MPTILNVFVMNNVVHNKNIQSGGHKQCEGYVVHNKNIQNGGHKQCEG